MLAVRSVADSKGGTEEVSPLATGSGSSWGGNVGDIILFN